MRFQIKRLPKTLPAAGLLVAIAVAAACLLPPTVSAESKSFIVQCEPKASGLFVQGGYVTCVDSGSTPKVKAVASKGAKENQSVVKVDCGGKKLTGAPGVGGDASQFSCEEDAVPVVTASSVDVNDQGKYISDRSCGSEDNYYNPAIDIGCRGKGNPIADMLFAIIRFLSAGAGLVIIGSIIVGGIQYSASKDNPQAVNSAVNRIQSSLIALLIFVFAYAIINYLVPGALLK